MAMQCEAVTRRLDNTLVVFQRFGELWMIDTIATPPASNDAGDEGDDYDAVEAVEGDDYDDGRWGPRERVWVDGSTAVSADELDGLNDVERRDYVTRQVRKLGLAPQGEGATVLRRMVDDFEGFAP